MDKTFWLSLGPTCLRNEQIAIMHWYTVIDMISIIHYNLLNTMCRPIILSKNYLSQNPMKNSLRESNINLSLQSYYRGNVTTQSEHLIE